MNASGWCIRLTCMHPTSIECTPWACNAATAATAWALVAKNWPTPSASMAHGQGRIPPVLGSGRPLSTCPTAASIPSGVRPAASALLIACSHRVAGSCKRAACAVTDTTRRSERHSNGRMGANMVRRLLLAGHQCVVFDLSPKAVGGLAEEGAQGASSMADLVSKLEQPRK